MTWKTCSAHLLIACLLAGFVAAHETSEGLDERISLDLKGADAADVLPSFGDIVGATVVVEPEVSGKITIYLEKVRARTAMDAICDGLDCAWRLEAGDPPELRFSAVDNPQAERDRPAGLETRISMSLEGAPASDVLSGFAQILSAELRLGPELDEKLSIELQDVTVSEGLDMTCQQLGCWWSLTEGRPPVLEVQARE
jgi:type II secretory pathway component HofQ